MYVVNFGIKKLAQDAVIPEYATIDAGCFDIRAHLGEGGEVIIHAGSQEIIPTKLSFELSHGWVILLFSRSGHGFNQSVRLGNCVGVIDSDYRGELKVALCNDGHTTNEPLVVRHGDRIAQAMIIQRPDVVWKVLEELTETERGEGGFGSTGVA